MLCGCVVVAAQPSRTDQKSAEEPRQPPHFRRIPLHKYRPFHLRRRPIARTFHTCQRLWPPVTYALASTLRETTRSFNTRWAVQNAGSNVIGWHGWASCLSSSDDAAGTSRTACYRAAMARIRRTRPTHPRLAGLHDGARIFRVGSTSSVSALAGASADARVAISSRCVFGQPTASVASIRAH